ncbi:ATP-dependent DNA helicase RecG [Rhodobacteraceae bacterium XHP0102]|nr:ATP-dependent DNA helicase RecG [Rhodobacteraceae bacterium XHP0102]
MQGRPEVLFGLFSSLEGLSGIGPKAAQALTALQINTPKDLIYTLPVGVVDRRRVASITEITPPRIATLEVEVVRHRPPPARGRGPYRVTVSDRQTAFDLVFFHARAPYLEKLLPIGARRVVSGKVELFDGIAQIVHPDHVLPVEEADSLPKFEPIYPLGQGVTQKMMARAIGDALGALPDLPEWIDPALKAREGWPGWGDAMRTQHHVQSASEAAPNAKPRLRLAYDELFAHQLTLALARMRAKRRKGRISHGDGSLRAKVLQSLPYSPTGAQTRAIAEIVADMAAPERMSRLLQGDVGAGKTLVALMALLAAVEAGGQGVMMAPTSILAQQHAANLRPLAEAAGVVLEVLTGADKGRERAAKLAALARGDIAILVGTHAVFQEDVEFADLRLAIVDEQHRFGVRERLRLGEKGALADMLVMTATPIPRTLSLAQYGDMDVSILDEKPANRQKITTALVSEARMDEVIAHLQKAVAEGQQAYWICPLVEESEVYEATAAEERFKSLRARLGEGVVGLVHGQMSSAEKDAAMAAFNDNRTKVLVATTVVEVGVDVPNVSIMVIEQADLFGMAQLHQLRGRVGRGSRASTCVLLYRNSLTETAKRRLHVLRDTEDGFVIAEEDLAIRGAGDVIGTAQSGLPRFRVADLEQHGGLMAMAQSDARALLALDPTLAGPRGQAARTLLWLLEQDKAIRLISAG